MYESIGLKWLPGSSTCDSVIVATDIPAAVCGVVTELHCFQQLPLSHKVHSVCNLEADHSCQYE